MLRIGVIGAGIMGLSSAVSVQQAFPHAKVTIIADQFGEDTTSSGAGGFFRPHLDDILHGNDPEVMKQCIRDSWKHYSSLAMSQEAKESGQFLVSGMMAYSKPKDDSYTLMKECCFDFHQMPVSELKQRGVPYEFAYSCKSVISQPTIYMDWLTKKFMSNGGELQSRTVKNFDELYGKFQLVINCCGLRAQSFLNDKECFPVRGQLVMVKAPWIKNFYFSEADIYIIPQVDRIVVGGIRVKGDWNDAVDPETSDSIMRKAETVFPELKGAQRLSSWAALRPGRTSIRLELESMDLGGNRRLPVIHNYGHGGHGITLSWGTAVQAAKLARKAISSLPKAAL